MTDISSNNHLLGQVTQLRQTGREHQQVEAKKAERKLNKDVWDTVSAFANSDGGTIFLGLDEDAGFTPTAGFDIETVMDQLLTGLREGQGQKIEPLPPYSIHTLDVDGAPVIALEILPIRPIPMAKMPCFVKERGIQKGSYKRVGSQDQHLSPYEIFILQNLKIPANTDAEIVSEASLNDLSTDRVLETFKSLRARGSHALDGIPRDDITKSLEQLNLIDNNKGIRLATYLSLATYPQKIYPQLTIDVIVHPTTERAEIAGLPWIDRRNCDGPIPIMIEDAVETVAKHLSQQRQIRGVSGEDVWEIPLEVLREAITNAVMHRDYSMHSRGQQVVVDVYPNRVEVISPGGLWGTRTIENLADEGSSSRNEHLAKLLSYLPSDTGVGAVCENAGTGVKRMIMAMRNSGLPAPDYSATTLDKVVVRLARFGLMEPDTHSWLNDMGLKQDEIRPRVALALANRDRSVDVLTLRNQLGIDSDEAREVLQELTKKHLLIGQGDGPYTLPSESQRRIQHLTKGQRELFDHLDPDNPLTIRELQALTGKGIQGVRRDIRALIELGLARATAEPTSRLRAYVSIPAD